MPAIASVGAIPGQAADSASDSEEGDENQDIDFEDDEGMMQLFLSIRVSSWAACAAVKGVLNLHHHQCKQDPRECYLASP